MSRTWLALAVIVFSSIAAAQNVNRESAGGRLTVTATVVGSSEIVLAPNGERRLIVVNAPAAEIATLTAILASESQNPFLTSVAQWVWPESLPQRKRQSFNVGNDNKSNIAPPAAMPYSIQAP
jgi:hypothetical protein